MLPRSQGRQIHTATPHRAHVKTRASAAATALASRGLYKSRRARDPQAGYPVHRATAAGDTRRPGIPARASTLRTPALLATPPRPDAIGFASPPVGHF
jgi:hypothetical protein